jgi:RND family efflux transporter MFP subunit
MENNRNPDMSGDSSIKSGSRSQQGRSRIVTLIFGGLLPVLVLGGGALIAVALMESGPKARREPPPRLARLVEVEAVQFSNQPVILEAMGTVRPARQIDLYPRVSGEVIWVSPELIPGGRFRKGQKIIQIDKSDYELTVVQREAEVAQAGSNLKIEKGQQSIAEREYELLGESIEEGDRDLILRTPQLESIQAELQKAQSELDRARLELDRTQVLSPFDAIVISREVDLGESVTSSTTIASLVGTNEFWIEALVSVDDLKWIRLPDPINNGTGSSARIYTDVNRADRAYRSGRVIRLAGDLEEEGRMARLLISITDPLESHADAATTPLLIGAYVRIEIEGEEIKLAAAIDRQFLRDGEYVWLMNADNALEIRPVNIAFRGRDRVLVVGGLKEGDLLIRTDLAAPVAGMPIRIQDGVAPDSSSEKMPGAPPQAFKKTP